MAEVLGFTALPLAFFLILLGMVLAYLGLVEFAKARFYATQGRPRGKPTTHEERQAHRIRRRSARFTEHHIGAVAARRRRRKMHRAPRATHGAADR
jgi:Mg2+-importing ATPase